MVTSECLLAGWLCNFSTAIPLFWKYAAWWDCLRKNLCNWGQVLPLAFFFWVKLGPEGLIYAMEAAQVGPLWLHIALGALEFMFNLPALLHYKVVFQINWNLFSHLTWTFLSLWFSFVLFNCYPFKSLKQTKK